MTATRATRGSATRYGAFGCQASAKNPPMKGPGILAIAVTVIQVPTASWISRCPVTSVMYADVIGPQSYDNEPKEDCTQV